MQKEDGISQRELDRIVHNDSEWREFMIRKIELVEKNQNKMAVTMAESKIKIGFLNSVFGALAGFAAAYLSKILGG